MKEHINLPKGMRGWYLSSYIMSIKDLNLTEKALLSRIDFVTNRKMSMESRKDLVHIFGIPRSYLNNCLYKLSSKGYITKGKKAMSLITPYLRKSNYDRRKEIFVPKEIVYIDNLTFSKKIILGYLVNFIQETRKPITIGNELIGSIFGFSKGYISNVISELRERGFITYFKKTFELKDGYIVSARYLSYTDENKEKVKEHGILIPEDNDLIQERIKYQGIIKLNQLWNKQYKKYFNESWEEESSIDRIQWSSFMDSILINIKNSFPSSDIDMTHIKESSAIMKKSGLIGTYHISLIERMIYIYMRERGNIFWNKEENAYTPSEFLSLHCLNRIVLQYYKNYYGESIHEHHTQIENFYNRAPHGEKLNPKTMKIDVAS